MTEAASEQTLRTRWKPLTVPANFFDDCISMQSTIFYQRTTKRSFIASTVKASSFKMRRVKGFGVQREKEKWTGFRQKLVFTLSEEIKSRMK
ncbi:hypothetical protein EMCG_08685 [[Emmonsia] crescens]|uniref:Uncharacterized protein n=1 Tax=[Emmonsia] crescens TaxID=73230 RepID=A0A0G2I5H1_9EURO|nr:hypothetical protein EMCG_08685 [Emmonsia crescens UAMH 3008]